MATLVNENNYGVPMNGGNPGASQWIWVDMHLYDDGTIEAPLRFTNDVFGESFCGGVHMELHDLRDNSLLAAFDSPTYCIGGKGFGGHENSATIGWRVNPSLPNWPQKALSREERSKEALAALEL